MRLNRKGQSLVMFIIIIPIIMLIFTLVYDVGSAIYEKNRISNTNYMVTNYALDNIETTDENKIIELIKENDNNLNTIEVVIENNETNVFLSKDVKGVLGKIFGFDLVTAKSEYKGYFSNNKKVIEKVR